MQHSGGLRIIDISDPTNIHEVGYFQPNPNYTARTIDVEVNGSIAYVAASNGLWVVDISDPTHPLPWIL
ncbi:MAG: hypothetical protein IPP40_15635 [bacterium]|nr:hypothetical protein [bacterium]